MKKPFLHCGKILKAEIPEFPGERGKKKGFGIIKFR
jgi:hypothetical protein